MTEYNPKLLILSYHFPRREWEGDSIEEANKIVDVIFKNHPEINKVEIIEREKFDVLERHIIPHPRWRKNSEEMEIALELDRRKLEEISNESCI